MALIKCEECGKEISDRAGKCPHCGCPVETSDDITDKKIEKLNIDNSKFSKSFKSPNYKLPIILTCIGFVLSLFSPAFGAILCLFSIIFSIIEVNNLLGKKWIFVVISVVSLGVMLSNLNSCAKALSANESSQINTELSTETNTSEIATETVPVTESTTETETSSETNINSSVDSMSEPDFKASCQEIDYKTLARNPDQYVGQNIKVNLQIFSKYNSSFTDYDNYYLTYDDADYPGTYMTNPYYVFDYRKKVSDKPINLLEKDVITVYGTFRGNVSTLSFLNFTTGDEIGIDMYYADLKE